MPRMLTLIGGTTVTRGLIVSFRPIAVGGITAIAPMHFLTILIGTVLDQFATDRFRTMPSMQGRLCIARSCIARFITDRLF